LPTVKPIGSLGLPLGDFLIGCIWNVLIRVCSKYFVRVWFLDVNVLLSPLCRTKALVLELLAAVCLVRGGHEIILAAFDHFKEVRKDILP